MDTKRALYAKIEREYVLVPWHPEDDDDWWFGRSPLYIKPTHRDYELIMETLRRRARDQQGHQHGRAAQRLEWVWGLPEPLRQGILGVVDDIGNAYDLEWSSAIAEVVFAWLRSQLGRSEDDIRYSHAEMVRAFSQPTTIARTIVDLANELEYSLDAALAQEYRVALQEAAG